MNETRPVRLEVRISGFHPEEKGSIPLRAIVKNRIVYNEDLTGVLESVIIEALRQLDTFRREL